MIINRGDKGMIKKPLSVRLSEFYSEGDRRNRLYLISLLSLGKKLEYKNEPTDTWKEFKFSKDLLTPPFLRVEGEGNGFKCGKDFFNENEKLMIERVLLGLGNVPDFYQDMIDLNDKYTREYKERGQELLEELIKERVDK